MKHKHADLIEEWALNANRVVQYFNSEDNWEDAPDPTWSPFLEYRFKPEPKPQ